MRKIFLLKPLLIFLIIYIHISFVFSVTVYKTERIGIVIYILLFLLSFMILLVISKAFMRPIRIEKPVIVCFVFMLYLSLYNFVEANYSIVFFYMSLVIILLVFCNCQVCVEDVFPFQLMMILEIFFLIGVYFQAIFPVIYDSFAKYFFESIYYQKIIWWSLNGYFSGFTHQLGTTGLYISYGIPLLLYNREKKTMGTYLMLILFYVGLIMTGKRIFFLIALVVPMIVSLFSTKKIEKRFILLLVSVGILVLLYSLFLRYSDMFIAAGGTLKRVAQSIIGSDTDITSGRIELWEKAIALFKSNPIFGVGIGNYSEMAFVNTEAHNAFLQLMAETGIVGLLLFVAMLIANMHYTIKKIRQSEKDNPYLKMSLYFQILYIIYSFTGNTITGTGEIGIYFLFFAFSLIEYDARDGSGFCKERNLIQ